MSSSRPLFDRGTFVTRLQLLGMRLAIYVLVAVVGAFGTIGVANAARLFAPTITATKTDSFVGGDGDGKADPGETIKYTVAVNNSGSDATGVNYNDTIDSNTTLVGGSVAASPVAADDTYPQTVIGNVSIDTSLIPYSVVGNDYLGLNPTATITAFDSSSAHGGTVSMTTSGTGIGQFTYDPPTGFTGTDTFTYTLADNASATSPVANRKATVTLTVSGKVWFVNDNAGACSSSCDGRLSHPFTSLAAFTAVNDGTGSHPGANDAIFLYESATSYTGGVSLLARQMLIGQDATVSLATITGLTPPSGSAPFPAMNTGAPATTINNAAGTAVSNATDVVPAVIRGLTLSGTSNAINLSYSTTVPTDPTRTVDIEDDKIAGSGTQGIFINKDGNFILTASVVNNTWSAASTGNAFDARTTATAGTTLRLNFSGNTNINSSADGVHVDGSAGGTITITGFANNTVSGNTVGNGIKINTATFDSDPVAAGFQQVSAGTTSIGASGNAVGAEGLLMAGGANLKGDLDFTDLDSYSTGAALDVSGAGAANTTTSTGLLLTMAPSVGTLNSSAGPAATVTNATVVLPFSTITSANSPTTGVSLTGINDGANSSGPVAASFSAASGSSISNATGTDFVISSNNADVTYGGTISDSSGGQLVSMNSNNGGTKSFTGSITDTGVTSTGISLTSNTGTTMSFSGGVTLTTGSNPAFTATGGGTVSVTGSSNTLTTTTGTALNVVSTSIGAGNLVFKSISAGTAASGPASGIILNTTGASGGLVVNGTGSAGSGGTIQKTTTAGISLTSVGGSVSLTDMNITTGTHDGVRGTTVNNLSLISSSVTNNGTVAADNGVHITDASGTVTFTNTSVTGSFGDNVDFDSTVSSTAVITTFTVTNGAFSSSANGAGFLIQLKNTAVIQTGSFSGATLNANATYAIDVVTNDTSTIGNGTGAPATGTFTFSGNTITNDGGVGVSFADGGGSGAANMYVRFVNNTMTGTHSHAVNVVSGAGTTGGTQKVLIDNNHIGTTGVPNSGSQIGEGIVVTQQGRTAQDVTITNNLIRDLYNGAGGFDNVGIDVEALGPTVSGQPTTTTNYDIVGNDVNQEYTGAAGNIQDAIYVAVDSQGGSAVLVHAAIHGNTVPTTDGPFGPGTGMIYYWQVTPPSTGTLYNFNGTGTSISNEIATTNTGTSGKTPSDDDSGLSLTGSAPTIVAFAPDTILASVQDNIPANHASEAQASLALSSSAAKTFTVAVAPTKAISKQAAWIKTSPVIETASANNGAGPAMFDLVRLLPLSGETVSVSVGTLPAGKSVFITYQVTVNGPSLPLGTLKITNQGTVSGSNFGDVLTTNGGPVDCEVGSETCVPVDRPDANLLSINRQTPASTPTNATSVVWRVTFDTPVAGLTSSNFSLANTGLTTPSISSVAAVTASPDTQWDVTVNTGTGDGTLGLNMVNDTGLSHDVFVLPFTGQTYGIDKTAPSTSSIVRQTPASSPTNADTLVFRITFSEAVQNIGTADFTATGGTTAAPSLVALVSPGVYDVTLSGGDLAGYNGVVGLGFSGALDITDTAGNALPNTAPGTDQTYTVDNTAPTVSNVSSTSANGAYTTGAVIPVTVQFSEAVTVTGTPQLTLETGATDETVNYTSGSGTATLTFNYTVQAGDTSADLDYKSTTALALNGGTIADAATNAADLTLATPGAAGSLGANKNIVIDTARPTVTNVSSTSANGSYGVGAVIPVTVTFSEPVLVTGTPQLTLETGVTDEVVNYASGSGTSTLTFSYTVQAGDTSADLDYKATTSLALNGGTIADAATNTAVLTLATPGAAGSLGFNKNIVIDTTAPTVINVTSTVANATYGLGAVIPVTVQFSEPVNVTGTPQLTLAMSGSPTTEVVDYSSGSGTDTLTFTYTAQLGDTSPDLDYVGTASLALNGGTIKDVAANAAVLTLPTPGSAGSLGFNKNIVINATNPVVTNVSSTTADGSYKAGAVIPVMLTFSHAVTVTGTPQLTLETGVTDETIDYSSGSGTTTLTFTYTVQAGDNSADLDYKATNSLTLNGGTIQDASLNDAVLTLPSPGASGSLGFNKNIVIDNVQPTVSNVSSTAANGSYDAGAAIPITVQFSEPVVVTGTPQLTLETGATDETVSYSSGSGTDTLTFTYTVQAGDTSADLDYKATTSLVLNGGTIKDPATNTAILTLASPGAAGSLGANKNIVIDTTAPTVTINQATGQSDPTSGGTINFTAVFSETVTGFATGDVTLGGTAGATTGTVTEIAPNDGTTYNVAVTGMSSQGTVIASLAAGVAQDVAGNPNVASTSTDNTVTFVPPTDLSITKTDGVTTAVPGGSVTYTITASNAGPNADPSAVVADTFPASLTTTWGCVGAGGGLCTASGSGNINDTVVLPVGGSVTYTVSATISPAVTGSLSNTATVTSSIFDTNLVNNSATDTDTLTPQADLSITKTDGVTSAIPGGSVTYTITASNAGPSNAPGANVADTFPASLTATWTCVGAGGGTCTASGSGNINDTVNLPAGGSVTYTASANISAAATGSLTNTATVSAPGGVTDPTPVNNAATDTDTLNPEADLSITKTDGVSVAAAGGSLTYTITASNAGPSDASGATVADTFPASLTDTWTCVGAGGGTCTASGSGNITDTVNLPAGGSVTYTAHASVSVSASGSLSNTATVTAPGGVTDPTPVNNSATDTDTVLPPVAVTIDQAPAQADPTNASPINFKVVFAAAVTGFGDASDVTLSGTAGATTVVITSSSSTVYNVAVSGMTGAGTVIASIPAGVATGSSGEPNAASTSTDHTVTYDATAPDTIIDTNPANPTNSTTATFTYHGDDGTGVGGLTFQCKLDSGAYAACNSGTITFTGLADGSHTFLVRASDSLGNTDASPASYTWTVDTTDPTVVVSSSSSDPTGSAPITFTITFSEPVTGFTPTTASGDIVIGGVGGTDSNPQTVSSTVYTFDLMPSAQGAVTVTVPVASAFDTSGNANTVSNTFSITYQTSITSDDTTTFATSNFGTFTVTTDALPVASLSETSVPALPATITFVDNGDGTATLSGTPVPGNEGTYTLTITASNGLLPNATQTFTLYIMAQPLFWNQSYGIKYDTWLGVTNPNAFDGGYRRATSGQFKFVTPVTTNKVTWLTYRGPDQGKAQLLVDGVVRATVDLYHSTPQWHYAFTITGLSNTHHTVVVNALNTKNPASTNKWVVVDAFQIKNTKYDDRMVFKSGMFSYGSWVGNKDAHARFGSYRLSSTANATFSFSFTGSKFDWMTARGSSYGKAAIYVDGVLVKTVDLYKAGATQWQYLVTVSGLSSGSHSVIIKVLGTKNVHSTGTGIVCDGINIP